MISFLSALLIHSDAPRITASHSHARGQLFGAQRGLLTVGAGDSLWVVPATHAVWVPPHCPHSLHSHGAFAGWSVYVDDAACAGLPLQPCVMQASGLLREAVLRAAQWDAGDFDAARQRVAGVILDEVASLPRAALVLPMPADARLRRIAQAIAADLADKRRMEDWAAWAGIAPRTLARRFLAETGFSFADWRQRARLMRALEMLAAERSVTAIALDLGYDNVSAFIAMFKRAFGVTPSRYFSEAE
ncbi:helix-turn-helix domain-containing protein [Massilia sp. NR 4-1]|uniref:AraC family transcriptional regulator n=1 Tax=Massilia sp. NR 4-1 TaxID=1678028 RepID=UPI00067BCF71|nr:helix-turn-helix transcriptional regulator [Massilia sp. NR 4-1]AKU22797.1 AraC family transcriptional regulator [Massilia sp. NR 4-1]